ncbi:MAG TPA: hypothetical protein VLT87_28665 [Thermoanaerobaculia bacterium]|nr:hypothetical protein [Thermoanaerobaculia bacterium]
MSGTRREILHLTGASLVLILGVWASSGTLAPYAATLAKPYAWEPCDYLLNIDHNHFKAVFLMLDGAPRDQWEYSVVLRRVLHPLLAYPFMKVLGFGAGGIAANLLLALGSIVVFWRALQTRYGGKVPVAILWLLATSPGIFYWAGLPYSYAIIVPASLVALVLLWKLETAAGWRPALLYGLGLGVLSTGYDLLPFFGAAGLLLLLSRRLWAPGAVFTVATAVPTALVAVALRAVFEVPFESTNTQAYGNIVGSYLSLGSLTDEGFSTWGRLLAKLPGIALDVYLYSNFLFLPLLFLLGLLAARWLPKGSPTVPRAEVCVLIAAVLLFLFTNLAPPYPGWQIRGSWLARLYQPVFGVMISTLAGLFSRADLLPRRFRSALWGALALTIAADLWIVFGPVLGATRLSQTVYHRFYRHDRPTAYEETLATYGRRPLGLCGRK